MRYALMSGAGNTFAVVDGFVDEAPRDPALLARRVCSELETHPDGLLLVMRPTRGGDCAMVLYNADGSRPETCGNGLRCVAKLVVDRGHVTRPEFVIESDAGPCATTVELEHGRVVRARIHMGTPRILARARAITVADGSVHATLVDVGNPHCVLFVEDERLAPVATRGAELERHPAFPRGTNVEFVAVRDGRAYLRVWERGVGETQACGSGACAAAIAAVDRGLLNWPVVLQLPGGELGVDTDGGDGVFLSGPVEELSRGDWSATLAPHGHA